MPRRNSTSSVQSMDEFQNEQQSREEFNVDTPDTGNPNLMVAVRVRPPNEKEGVGIWRNIIRVLDKHVLIFDPATTKASTGGFIPNSSRSRDYKYAFDRVFDDTSTQQEVFEETTKGLIDAVLNGFNATVFAYGATGAGKTHTMIGNAETGAGVMVLTMKDLFNRIEDSQMDKKYKISLQYLEIYNETIRDLFVEDSPPLMLCEDAKGVKVSNLSEKFPANADEVVTSVMFLTKQVFQLLEFGNKNRRQSPTDANATSSRSHAVLQILVKQKDRTADISASVRVGKLSLIDLAGSERACVSNNRGERLKEGANINRSLLALGNCINSLGENYKKGKHVPYRNSKLTRLLKDSLGGNCRTVMIANISPSSMCYEDTLNTLKYANRAKNIKTKVTRNVVNVNYHVAKYTEIIKELRNEVAELRSKLQSSQGSRNSGEQEKQVQRLQSNLSFMKEVIKEQYTVLSENNLVTNRLRDQWSQVNQINPSPRRVREAWVPVSQAPEGSLQPLQPNSSGSFLSFSQRLINPSDSITASPLHSSRSQSTFSASPRSPRTVYQPKQRSPKYVLKEKNFSDTENIPLNSNTSLSSSETSATPKKLELREITEAKSKKPKSILKKKRNSDPTKAKEKRRSNETLDKKSVFFSPKTVEKHEQKVYQPKIKSTNLKPTNVNIPIVKNDQTPPTSKKERKKRRSLLADKENIRSALYAPKHPPTSKVTRGVKGIRQTILV